MKWTKSGGVIALLALIGFIGAAPAQERALVEPAMVRDSIELARMLSDRDGKPVPDGERWFKVITGTQPVVITAPHATRPLRNGKRRFSDGGGTAALAVALGELTGATVIHTTWEGPSDPNYYDDNDFKRALKKVIEEVKPKLVLDLHGSHPYRSYDVDFGTMNGESLLGDEKLLDDLAARLRAEGLVSQSDNRFAAAKNQTIAKFAARAGVPAIQLEVNATWVNPERSDLYAHRYSKLLQGLARYVRAVVE